MYSFAFRYASGNTAGGGPFHLELDGSAISGDIAVPSTSATVWNIWATKTVINIPLTPGQHVLRVAFSNGEFNLAKMTFTLTGDLVFSYPTAISGSKLKVLLPLTSSTLDGSASTESANKVLTYSWTQNYGPSVIQFSDAASDKPVISGLAEGMYSLKLKVTNPDLRSDDDELLVMVSSMANVIPTVSLISPAEGSAFTAGDIVNISAFASDFDGNIQQVDFYLNNVFISTDISAPYTATWTSVEGASALTAIATDNEGAIGNSQTVNITVDPKMTCTEASNIATEGAFTVGYKCTFETVGTNVTVTFELLDDKTGVAAYLRKAAPFTELPMANVSGKIFATTLSGQTSGATISYACKFAFAGGLAVTKYFLYQVGKNCGITGTDTEKPTNYTATVGAITANSVGFLLQASDNSGTVIFNISYGTTKMDVSVASGVLKSFFVTGLTPVTNYTFAVEVKDITGNAAVNSPIMLNATTSANTNTECAGLLAEASQGDAFSIGYKYSFVTTGSNVKINFELLDDKTGVVAYLWNQAPFAESAMTLVSGKAFTKTISGQSNGSIITYACKFAYAGGMSVAKYLSYLVVNTCVSVGFGTEPQLIQSVYPNPVSTLLYLQLSAELNHIVVTDILGNRILEAEVQSRQSLDMSEFKTGIFFLKIENTYGIQYIKVVKE